MKLYLKKLVWQTFTQQYTLKFRSVNNRPSSGCRTKLSSIDDFKTTTQQNNVSNVITKACRKHTRAYRSK